MYGMEADWLEHSACSMDSMSLNLVRAGSECVDIDPCVDLDP